MARASIVDEVGDLHQLDLKSRWIKIGWPVLASMLIRPSSEVLMLAPPLRLFVLRFALACLSACSPLAHCQANATPGDSANIRLQVRQDELTVAIPLVRRVEKSKRVSVRLVLLNPDDVVRAQLTESIELVNRQKQLVLKIARPFEKVPASEMEALHWLRLKYEVTSQAGEIIASGIEALHAATTDPFVLTAAASRVAAPGRPYRVQVHVKNHNGQALSRVEVHGDLTWDEDDANDKKVSAKAITSAAGNATLEFPIPYEVHADDGDLTVGVKSGLVARSVERSVEFRTPSYLLLDTDKDIYQPEQTLHARMLRFNSERRAVNNETLDVRIEDEERTLAGCGKTPFRSFSRERQREKCWRRAAA